MNKHIIVTVEFADQLAATNKPVHTLDEARKIIHNEVNYPNTVQAYAWNKHNGVILYCLHGRAGIALRTTVDIDTLVEDDRI